MFNRAITKELEAWKNKEDRKPLMMLGARQVGKTSVLKRFGKEQFDNCAYFSLDEEKGVSDIFRTTKNPLQIIEQLSFLTEEPILPQKTLIVLQIIEHRLINLFSLRLYHSQLVCREGKLLRLLLQINIQLSQRRRQHLDEHFHAGMQLGHNRQHKEGQKADNDCKAQKQTYWTLETRYHALLKNSAPILLQFFHQHVDDKSHTTANDKRQQNIIYTSQQF